MPEYAARLERVVDGDTCDVLLDLGLGVFKFERLRLAGVDAPETRSRDAREKALGEDAKRFAEAYLGAPGTELLVDVLEVSTGKCTLYKYEVAWQSALPRFPPSAQQYIRITVNQSITHRHRDTSPPLPAHTVKLRHTHILLYGLRVRTVITVTV
jgi:hypothetical protein